MNLPTRPWRRTAATEEGSIGVRQSPISGARGLAFPAAVAQVGVKSHKMIAYQIYVNGKKLATADVRQDVVSAI